MAGGSFVKHYPYVSIIVPAYNSCKSIGKLIESLLRQTYPRDSFEIIIVDNNSNDATAEIIKKYPVRYFNETRARSSYAARNTGIKRAGGEVFAFIDADCAASEDWLRQGVNKLFTEKADMIGGKVDFIFSENKTASEIYDAITHFNMERGIKVNGATGAGNLFVKTKVFQDIGFFPGDARSGGDMRWTREASQRGYKLVYSPEALVFHPARDFKEMIKKGYRVGGGSIDILMARGAGGSEIVYKILRDFVPPSILSIKRRAKEKRIEVAGHKLLGIFIVAYLFRVTRGMGMITRAGSSVYSFLSPSGRGLR
jgi:glycosyltransferase AglE